MITGGTLPQMVDEELQPLAFFSQKLSQTERIYSEFNREVLAADTAIKHFRQILEVRNFFFVYRLQTPNLRFPAALR